MRELMAKAEVGDDVYGEDPTVNLLQETAAALLGKEAALFLPSGTQSNLTALLTHCRRGEEYIVGERYHIYAAEAAGGAVLGGLSPHPVPTTAIGGLTVKAVAAAIKDENNTHYARSRLLCLENTVKGRVQEQNVINELAQTAHEHGLRVHLDGARLMNAAVAQNVSANELAAAADSVSLCLSKSLGAPIGTMLCGSADFIYDAKRNRKLLGGGMRQAGMMAVCGLYALENNIYRLIEDHESAFRLFRALEKISALEVDFSGTNMVFFKPPAQDHEPLRRHLAVREILIGGQRPMIRMVTHLDVSPSDIDRVIGAFEEYYT